MTVDVLRLLTHAPTILRVAANTEKAKRAWAEGDLATLKSFVTDDLLDAAGLVHDRLPSAGRELLAGVERAWGEYSGSNAPVYDPTPPWADLKRHLYARDWGVVVILGGKGFGKTVAALKLAWTFRKLFGYRVETVGLWDDDRPPWAASISMERLIRRTRKIGKFLDQDEDAGDDGLEEGEFVKKSKTQAVTDRRIDPSEIERMKRRVIVVDEAEVFFSGMGGSGQEGARAAARNLNNQARHLKSWFIFITQNMSAMPTYLRGSAVLFYKMASPEVVQMDYVSGQWRANRQRWTEVLAALNAIKSGGYVEPFPDFMSERTREAIHRAAVAHQAYWVPPYDDIRAWAYCVAGDLGGHGINCVVPFSPWQTEADAATTIEESDELDEGEDEE